MNSPRQRYTESVSTERAGLSSRDRTARYAIALIAGISLVGACSTGDSSAKTAERDRRAAEANKADAARFRAAVAVARSRAAVGKRRATPTTRAPATSTTIETRAAITRSGDLSAIRSMVDAVNAAFRSGVASGITSSAAASYRVGNSSSSREQCTSFESARGQGIVSEEIVVHAGSLEPAPGWVDPTIGKVPRGRTYRMAIDEIQT
ncbi:MAG: hypothetical protein QOG50_1702, partial [Actinomycetota bacterium]|nr:hypothetical protein [Actinomycetota bacterium]